MIAQFEVVSTATNQTFSFNRFEVPFFDAPFHYHPQLELTFIEKGSGKRYVGEDVANFEAGDLILVGANVPHCWICDQDYLAQNSSSISYVIQFSQNFLTTDGFTPIPEFQHLTSLFQKASNGLVITHSSQVEIIRLMKTMQYQTEIGRLSSLIQILDHLSASENIQTLTNTQSYEALSSSNREKLQIIYSHIINHYFNKIELQEIAKMVDLSPNAFCRFFKQLTKKTLTEVVNSYRLNHAVNLLTSTSLNISEIAYDSGFNTIPYFNTVFKQSYGCHPSQYRKARLGQIQQ